MKNNRGIKIFAVLSLCLVLIIGIAGALAYLTDTTSELKNTFSPSHVDCDVQENVKDGFKNNVKIKNIGDVDAYIRVCVVANTVDAKGSITGAFDVTPYLAGEDWVKLSDGYYYYKNPVAPEGYTGELLTGSIPLTGVTVDIMADAIQYAPEDAMEYAWGVTPDDFN